MTTNNQYLMVLSEIGMARLKAAFGSGDDIRFLPVVGCNVSDNPNIRLLGTEIPQIDATLPVTDDAITE